MSGWLSWSPDIVRVGMPLTRITLSKKIFCRPFVAGRRLVSTDSYRKGKFRNLRLGFLEIIWGFLT